jgi:alkylated DNA nucleotide flippase Atl1
MKYEVTSETKLWLGKTLYRVRALISFGSVNAGDTGGWIEKKDNLRQDGNAWVSGNARVYGNAQVSGDAWVSGNAQVSGDAWVSGNAQVSGDARVSGDAWVSGNARSIQADLWMVLTQNRAEVPGLLAALRAGRVDGSTYEGECACLVGTIANIRQVDHATLSPDSDRPCERWFMMIKRGDTPETSHAAKQVEAWILEWMACNSMSAVQ